MESIYLTGPKTLHHFSEKIGTKEYRLCTIFSEKTVPKTILSLGHFSDKTEPGDHCK